MKVSVVIITHNRKEDLVRTIKGYRAQTHPDKEIIIIDNASNDGTKEMMAQDYPEIKYLWLPDNYDIKAINLGIEFSSGDIIWRTDDDSFPESPEAFRQAIDIFKKHDDIHVIATEDVEVRKDYEVWNWYPYEVDKENVPEKGYKANIFPGTGAAIRREVYEDIGGFWEFGFEELDFCTRAIVAGYSIRYFPQIRTLHFAAPAGRVPAKRWLKASNQFIRYQWKYFPFWMALGRSFLIYYFQLLLAVTSFLPFPAIMEGILSMPATALRTYREERRPVPKDLIEDITLGVSLWKTQVSFLKIKFSDLFKKWKKK